MSPTFTGSTLTSVVANLASTVTGYASQTWTIECASDILISQYQADIFAAGTYTLSIDGTPFATAVVATSPTAGVVFTPAAPVQLAPGTHTFAMVKSTGTPFWYVNNTQPSDLQTGTGADFLTYGYWQEPGTQVNTPAGTLSFQVADGTLVTGIVRNTVSGGSLAAQTWSVTFTTEVRFLGLIKSLRDADATGYVLKIDGVTIDTVTKPTGTALIDYLFLAASPVTLTAGAHTFKLEPSTSRRWTYRSGTGTADAGTGAAYVSAWGTWAEAATNQVNARIIFTLPPPPDLPENLALVTAGTTSLEVEWDAPSAGETPTGYDVRIDGGTPTDVGLVLTHTFTSLTPETSYLIEVRAYAATGDGAWASLTEETLPAGPTTAYAVWVRIGTHVWDIEAGDVADPDGPEVLAGATFNWTAPDNVAWPPPMWTVPRDVCQLRVRCPDAAEVEDVRKGDVVRFKFTPEGYDYAEPLVDFAGIVTGDPTITDDRGGGVILQVTASDYRVLLSQASVEGETIIAEEFITQADDALRTLSDAIDLLNPGLFPGVFGDVTVGAVDPRGFLTGFLGVDVIVPTDAVATALSLFAAIGMVPIPVYDDSGDLDPVQPFKIVEPDPYGENPDTPAAISAALIPNSSVAWKRDYIPDAVQYSDALSGYLWMGGVPGDPLTATVLRTSNLSGFNQAGFSNMVPESEPWSLYVFTVLGYINPEAVRDWFVYPQRVQQYLTIEDVELIKAPSGTDTVSGMLKGATLHVGARGRWTVQAGLRNHGFGTP